MRKWKQLREGWKKKWDEMKKRQSQCKRRWIKPGRGWFRKKRTDNNNETDADIKSSGEVKRNNNCTIKAGNNSLRECKSVLLDTDVFIKCIITIIITDKQCEECFVAYWFPKAIKRQGLLWGDAWIHSDVSLQPKHKAETQA